MYDITSIYQAQSADDAIAALRADPSAVVIAGGTDVLIKCREGKLAGCRLVSIHELQEELAGVHLDDSGDVRIGSLTTFRGVTYSDVIRKTVPVLGEAADTAGGPQLRAAGTIGGNVCNGVTSADTAPTLFAYDAELELSGAGGTRRLGIAEFYLGPGRTDVRADELLTAIYIPRISWELCFGRYIKYSMREALDISTLGCSVNARLSEDGRSLERVRIAYGVAGPVPCRCPETESAFAGAPCTEETAREFARAAVAEISPRDSWRASRAFRLHVAEECAFRALCESVERAGGRL